MSSTAERMRKFVNEHFPDGYGPRRRDHEPRIEGHHMADEAEALEAALREIAGEPDAYSCGVIALAALKEKNDAQCPACGEPSEFVRIDGDPVYKPALCLACNTGDDAGAETGGEE